MNKYPPIPQHSHRRVRLAAACALLFVGPVVPAVTAAAEQGVSTATLSTTPGYYVGGQDLRWTGNIGHTGVRRLELEYNMGRVWNTVEGFSPSTDRNGGFSFHFPAPSMMNIRYRVRSGRYSTPARTFVAKTQDLSLQLTGLPPSKTNAPAAVLPGQSFGLTVDTTPDDAVRNPGAHDLPVFEGRTLTLQRRTARMTWQTLDTTTVDSDGIGTFSGLSAPAGVSVYRAREENWFEHGDRIGWTQSFPLYVLSGAAAQLGYAAAHGANQPGQSLPAGHGLGPQPKTASQRYRWFPAYFDFAWEYGQSLSSPPARGKRIQGHWQDYSDGAGRVSKYNGGLAIDSKRYAGAGDGDFGTTMATLHGNAISYGRWETSLRFRNSFEDTGHPFQVRAELIPARASDYDCGAHDITVAQITPFSKVMRYGVRTKQHAWSGRTTAPDTPRQSVYNVAVEVAKGHVTWFLDSRPVGSVTSKEAVPGMPLTLRLSMRGDGDQEMDQAGLSSDWQRGFPIDTGTQTVSGHHLHRDQAPALDCSAP